MDHSLISKDKDINRRQLIDAAMSSDGFNSSDDPYNDEAAADSEAPVSMHQVRSNYDNSRLQVNDETTEDGQESRFNGHGKDKKPLLPIETSAQA